VTPSSLVEIHRRFRRTFSLCMQIRRVTRLYEGGGCTFLRNVGKFLPVYTASLTRRTYSSKYCTFLCFTSINYLLHKRYQVFRRRHLCSLNEPWYGGIVPVQTLKAHGGVAVWLHLLLHLHQTKVSGENLRLCCFTFGERATVPLSMRHGGPQSRSGR